MSGSNLSRLIDSLSGRLGRDAVVGVKMEDNPLPEKAFTALPLAGNAVLLEKSRSSSAVRPRPAWKGSPQFASLRNRMQTSPEPSPEDPMRRPCAMLAQAVPLAVAFGNGPFHHDVSSPKLPSRVRLAGVVHTITAHWGPERIETGWWQGPSIGRDYYRIETDQGRWWWIFRNLRSKNQSESGTRYCWMLHGRFD